MTTVQSLRNTYSQLTPQERCDMILEAAGRGDAALVEVLLNSGPTSLNSEKSELVFSWAQGCAVSPEKAQQCHEAWLEQVGSDCIKAATGFDLKRFQAAVQRVKEANLREAAVSAAKEETNAPA